jgi:HlyD family secretion protein
MKRKWKIILGVVVAFLVMGFMVFESTRPLETAILEVQPGTIATTFKEEGKAIPKEQQFIYTAYSGKVADVVVEEGQEVGQGDLLAVVDSKELDYQLQQMLAQLKSLQGEKAGTLQETSQAQLASQKLLLEQASMDLKTVDTNLKRIEQLYLAGAATEKDYQDAKHLAEQAKVNLELQERALSLLEKSASPGSATQQLYEGRIEALQAQIDLLKYQKEQTRIVAPIAGIISNLAIKKGEVAGPAAPLMEVFDPASFIIEVYVLAADVHSIDVGARVDLIIDGKGEDIISQGNIRSIAPSAVERISILGLEEQRVRVVIETDKSSDIRLFPGYRLDVEFMIDQKENVLTVPKTTLFHYNDGDALWVVADGKARIQPIKTGFNNNKDVVIVEGLNPGDLVILNPQLEGLAEGKRIKYTGEE